MPTRRSAPEPTSTNRKMAARQLALNGHTVLRQTYHHGMSLRMYEAVPDGGSILDVGCGSGYFTHWLNENKGPTIGIDCVETFIQAARSRHGVEARLMDVRSLEFSDASFATVCADNVLEHCLNPVAACSEIARVLEPGGTLLALIPPDGLDLRETTLAHVWKPTPTEVREVAEAAGFEVLALETWNTWTAYGFAYPPAKDLTVFLHARKPGDCQPSEHAAELGSRLERQAQAYLTQEALTKEVRAGRIFQEALAKLQEGAIADARAGFAMALSINPSFKEAYAMLGEAWELEAHYGEAISQYRWLLERLNRDHSGARCGLARCLNAIGEREEAALELAALQRYNPDVAVPDNPAYSELLGLLGLD